MGYSVIIKKGVLKDLKKIKSNNLITKFNELIEILKNNPYQTPPPYEKLIGSLKGKYSRRLNIQHRLVYEVDEDNKEVIIYSCWTHYER